MKTKEISKNTQQKQLVMNRILLFILSLANLVDGIIGVLTLGFIRTKVELYFTKKYSKWKYRSKYSSELKKYIK